MGNCHFWNNAFILGPKTQHDHLEPSVEEKPQPVLYDALRSTVLEKDRETLHKDATGWCSAYAFTDWSESHALWQIQKIQYSNWTSGSLNIWKGEWQWDACKASCSNDEYIILKWGYASGRELVVY